MASSRLFQIVLALVLLLPFVTFADQPPAPANTKSFDEGVHYEVLANPVATPGSKLQVMEFFWYGCPHCYRLEPTLEAWHKRMPADVELVRMAAVLNPAWSLHARAFFAAEALGVTDKIHAPLFQALHEQGRRLNTEDALVKFIGTLGVDEAAFKNAMNSMGVEAKLRRSQELGNLFRLTGVPALVVAGRYRVIGNGVVSHQELFDIVDFLLEKERKRLKTATP